MDVVLDDDVTTRLVLMAVLDRFRAPASIAG